jgi:hypothetical protein
MRHSKKKKKKQKKKIKRRNSRIARGRARSGSVQLYSSSRAIFGRRLGQAGRATAQAGRSSDPGPRSRTSAIEGRDNKPAGTSNCRNVTIQALGLLTAWAPDPMGTSTATMPPIRERAVIMTDADGERRTHRRLLFITHFYTDKDQVEPS